MEQRDNVLREEENNIERDDCNVLDILGGKQEKLSFLTMIDPVIRGVEQLARR